MVILGYMFFTAVINIQIATRNIKCTNTQMLVNEIAKGNFSEI